MELTTSLFFFLFTFPLYLSSRILPTIAKLTPIISSFSLEIFCTYYVSHVRFSRLRGEVFIYTICQRKGFHDANTKNFFDPEFGIWFYLHNKPHETAPIG